MKRYLFLALAAALFLSSAAAHAQFIFNGTLTANANGWSLAGGCVPAQWVDDTGNPPGSILLNSCGEPDTDPTASQTISGLTVGATYKISVDIHVECACTTPGTGKTFGIFLNNEPGNPLVMTEFVDGNWHTVTATFTATSTSATIIFAAELDARTPGGPGTTTDVSYFIDNISVDGPPNIPALSTSALMLLGLLLAGCGVIVLRKQRAA